MIVFCFLLWLASGAAEEVARATKERKLAEKKRHNERLVLVAVANGRPKWRPREEEFERERKLFQLNSLFLGLFSNEATNKFWSGRPSLNPFRE